MFKNTAFEPFTKINAATLQEAIKPIQDNLAAWGALAVAQGQAAQSSMMATSENFKAFKEPHSALFSLDSLKASAENVVALSGKHLTQATALSVTQFHGAMDSIEKSNPAVFTSTTTALKNTASTLQHVLASTLKKCGDAADKQQSA